MKTNGSLRNAPQPDFLLEVHALDKIYSAHRQRRPTLREWLRRQWPGVSKQPPQHLLALRDISFNLRRGESLGVVGRNGSGKSTLLRILAGITTPSAGRVIRRGGVAAILDFGSSFHPELTGMENIFYNGRIAGFSRDDVRRRIDAIVDFSETGEFLHMPVKYYSSGMFLRLAFAVAAHLERDLMLFDEVLAVGDAGFQLKCQEKIQDLRAEGRSFIIVSHSLKDVAPLCDRVLVLDRGRMLLLDRPAEAIRRFSELLFDEASTPVADTNGAQRTRRFDELVEIADFGPVNGSAYAPCDSFTDRQEIAVRLRFAWRCPDAAAHLGLSVADVNQTLLFGDSTFSHSVRLDGRPHRSQQITWTIPGNLLNTGVFYLHLHLLDERLQIIGRKRNASKFTVKADGDAVPEHLRQLFPFALPLGFRYEPYPCSSPNASP